MTRNPGLLVPGRLFCRTFTICRSVPADQFTPDEQMTVGNLLDGQVQPGDLLPDFLDGERGQQRIVEIAAQYLRLA